MTCSCWSRRQSLCRTSSCLSYFGGLLFLPTASTFTELLSVDLFLLPSCDLTLFSTWGGRWWFCCSLTVDMLSHYGMNYLDVRHTAAGNHLFIPTCCCISSSVLPRFKNLKAAAWKSEQITIIVSNIVCYFCPFLRRPTGTIRRVDAALTSNMLTSSYSQTSSDRINRNLMLKLSEDKQSKDSLRLNLF